MVTNHLCIGYGGWVFNCLYREKVMEARCVEQNDSKSHVSHEVTNVVDGNKYRLVISAECPMTAIRIAREVPLTYWEQLTGE
jgi:hypothetical protein